MSGYHRLIVRAEARPVVYEGMRTPWGAADNAEVVAPGIGWVGTPGHGGVKLSPAMNRRMPDYMRQRGGWYEEDCDWSLPYVFFAGALRAAGESGKALADAMETLRNWHPAAYEQFTGEEIPEGQSHIKDKRLFSDRHANDLVAVSAINSSERPGMVEVTATVGGVRDFGGARRFLVPHEEYDTRGSFGFVIEDPARYEEITGARRASSDDVDIKPPPRPARGGPVCPNCDGDAEESGTPGRVTCFHCGYEGPPAPGSAREARIDPEQHGGAWGEHPSHPVSDWQYEVANGDTRLGYWEWARHRDEEV